jgi:hypothetical protein
MEARDWLQIKIADFFSSCNYPLPYVKLFLLHSSSSFEEGPLLKCSIGYIPYIPSYNNILRTYTIWNYAQIWTIYISLWLLPSCTREELWMPRMDVIINRLPWRDRCYIINALYIYIVLYYVAIMITPLCLSPPQKLFKLSFGHLRTVLGVNRDRVYWTAVFLSCTLPLPAEERAVMLLLKLAVAEPEV